jgi:hypothetical protein
MTVSDRLNLLAKTNMHNIEHVRVVEKHIKELELKIESRDIEIERMNSFCWNQMNLIRFVY